jgi:phosphatidylglycerol lysyltransferase
VPAVTDAPKHQSLLAALRKFGADAVSFLALESRMQFLQPHGSSPGSVVAYMDTGRAWVAVGLPLAENAQVGEVARAFVREAKKKGRRACFFACEDGEVPGFARLLLGEQPVWTPGTWRARLAQHRRLREQIRRAAAKGVAIRRVRAGELAPGTALRAQVESLARDWLASRRMAPMGFLVALEPFHLPEEHRYFIAERQGKLVEFLSAVPIYLRGGWLVEDVVRSGGAPNGTTEALLDGLMQDVGETDSVTLGLAPLSGPISSWLRVVRFVSRPLFDFAGLHAFRQRLRPAYWQRVWLVYPASESPVVHVLESLRAFAGDSLAAFAVRSIIRGPSGPPWALALPLVPWTLVLAALAMSGQAGIVGFSAHALAAWAVFDALLAVQLFWSALRPKRSRMALAAAAASFDAGLSVPHLFVTGLGRSVAAATLRSLAALAPCGGAAVLAWLALQRPQRFN